MNNDERKKIAIMDWDDQFDIASILISFLEEE